MKISIKLFALAAIGLFLAIPARIQAQESSFGKSLVIIFSPMNGETMNTIVNRIVSATGAEIFQIEPAVPYPASLDQMMDEERVRVKKGTPPELKNPPPDLSGYDTVFVGTTAWFGDRPDIVALFLSQADFKGAKAAFFAYTGPKPDDIIKSLSALAPNAQILRPGLIQKRNDDNSEAALIKKTDAWLSGLK